MSTAQNKKLRVVLDTNVFISIFNYRHSVLFPLWERVVRRQYIVIVSPAIIAEVADVLRRKFRWEEHAIIKILKLITRRGELVQPTKVVKTISDDPADNRILECAIKGVADLIVSGDQHLLRLKSFEGIPIVRPTDFLRTLGTREARRAA